MPGCRRSKHHDKLEETLDPANSPPPPPPTYSSPRTSNPPPPPLHKSASKPRVEYFCSEMSVLVKPYHWYHAAHASDINSVTFLDSSCLASAGGDKAVRLWNTNHSKGPLAELPSSPLLGHTYYVNCVKFSPFGTMLASCSTDGKVILWDVHSGTKLTSFQHPSCGALKVCCFSPNSTLLVTGSDDETLIIWNIADRKPVRQLEGHEGAVSAVGFSPDSTYIVSGSTNGDLRLWDARYGHGRCLVCDTEAHDLGVMACDFAPSSASTFASTPSTPPSKSTSTSSTPASTSTSTGQYCVATCGNDKLVKVWWVRVSGGAPRLTLRYELTGHAGHVMAVTYSGDGKLLASGGGDHSICIWNPNSGELLCKVVEHSRYVTSVAFSNDGRLLASGSNDRKIILWQISSSLCGEPKSRAPSVSQYVSQQCKVLSEWTVGEVCVWLTQLHLPQYVESFQQNQMDGTELMRLNHDMLINMLGVEALGHRNKMLRSVDRLKSGGEGGGEDVPGEYLCPITHEMMYDPVILSDGYSYERSAIEAWLASCEGEVTSPMTNERLENLELTANRMLRMLIQRHAEK